LCFRALGMGLSVIAIVLLVVAPVQAQEEVEANEVSSQANEQESTITEGGDHVEEDDDEGEIEPPERLLNVTGRFEIGADAIWTDGERDLTFDQWLTLRVDSPKLPNVRFYGSLWMHEDLDSDESVTSSLFDINDTYDSDVQTRLLHLYLEVDNLIGDSTLRIGRQRILESPEFNRIDGVYFQHHIGQWDWYLFGGVRASLFESSHDEPAYGGGLAWRPDAKTRIALDAFYGEEDRVDTSEVFRPLVSEIFDLPWPRRVKTEFGDNRWTLSAWRQITQNTQFNGRLSFFDADVDELRLEVRGYVPSWDLTYRAAYRGRLQEAGDRVDDLTAFFRILGPLEEYNNFLLSLTRAFGEKYAITLETEFHEAEEGDVFRTNRDYQRYEIIASGDGLWKDINASFGVSFWNVNAGDSTLAITGEMTKKWEKLALTFGVDFSKFYYTTFEHDQVPWWTSQAITFASPNIFPGNRPLVYLLDTDFVQESEDIYTVYSEVKWQVKENQSLRSRITFEEDDGPDSPYWRLQLNYAFHF